MSPSVILTKLDAITQLYQVSIIITIKPHHHPPNTAPQYQDVDNVSPLDVKKPCRVGAASKHSPSH